MWSEADEECGRREAAKVQADEERRAAENQSRLSDVALFGRDFDDFEHGRTSGPEPKRSRKEHAGPPHKNRSRVWPISFLENSKDCT